MHPEDVGAVELCAEKLPPVEIELLRCGALILSSRNMIIILICKMILQEYDLKRDLISELKYLA